MLRDNLLTGAVPPELAAINPVVMELQNNKLSGDLPQEFSSSSRLRRIYIAVFRYCKALELISKGNATSFTKIVHDLDYFDQSHFNKEFARFMDGHSPTEALQIIKSKLRGDEDLTNNGLLFG